MNVSERLWVVSTRQWASTKKHYNFYLVLYCSRWMSITQSDDPFFFFPLRQPCGVVIPLAHTVPLAAGEECKYTAINGHSADVVVRTRQTHRHHRYCRGMENEWKQMSNEWNQRTWCATHGSRTMMTVVAGNCFRHQMLSLWMLRTENGQFSWVKTTC